MENQGTQIRTPDNKGQAPNALKTWFVIHFAADILFAIPLMIIPCELLTFLGWETVDPVAARLVAAALFGIGIESLLGRNASIETFRAMLNLKIIWSSAAIIGFLLCILPWDCEPPLFIWALLAIFLGFNILWVYWRRVLEKMSE